MVDLSVSYGGTFRQVFDRCLLGFIVYGGGERGGVFQFCFVWEGSCIDKEGCSVLEVVVWDSRGGGSWVEECGSIKGVFVII